MNEILDNLSTTTGLVTLLFILFVLLAIWQALNFVELRRLRGFYERLVAGTQGGTMEQVLTEHLESVIRTRAQMEQITATVEALQESTQQDLQRLSLVRFNPFEDTGGDQSFILVLADSVGNGVLVTSLHGRDMTRVYGRVLQGWDSQGLSDEEKQAIEEARTQPFKPPPPEQERQNDSETDARR